MSKKNKSIPESTETTSTEEEEKESPAVVSEEPEEAPLKEEKPKRKSRKEMKRAKLTVLQAAVLETIREHPQRPRAIRTIIRGTGGVDIPRNEIIRSLNELKNKGLVEKVTAKAWQAK